MYRKGGSKWTGVLVVGFTVNLEHELALEDFCFSGLRPGLEDGLLRGIFHLILALEFFFFFLSFFGCTAQLVGS